MTTNFDDVDFDTMVSKIRNRLAYRHEILADGEDFMQYMHDEFVRDFGMTEHSFYFCFRAAEMLNADAAKA